MSSTTFSRLERKAQRYLDTWTQDRLKNATVIPDIVKETLTEMIDFISANESGEKLSSFSNGKVSMSFDNSKSEEEQLYYIVSMMLPLGLISRVVD